MNLAQRLPIAKTLELFTGTRNDYPKEWTAYRGSRSLKSRVVNKTDRGERRPFTPEFHGTSGQRVFLPGNIDRSDQQARVSPCRRATSAAWIRLSIISTCHLARSFRGSRGQPMNLLCHILSIFIATISACLETGKQRLRPCEL